MDKKAKAEIKRTRKQQQKEDAESGIVSDNSNSSDAVPEPTQEELDGLF
ncbi:MAG: hypothetical protein O2983_07240 [Planctomycetota bacterium]|nr:hypothetical protein [Planctomycetota bacterium]MDA0917941.1 hypothetical protein [Planctomycetota bacterium]MDA1159389.1 hypothetical protein [Planctomycetota bacterium]